VSHHAHFTCLSAIRAVIQAVHAQPDSVLPLADAAVPLARAFPFGLIANRADHFGGHAASAFTLYEQLRARQAAASAAFRLPSAFPQAAAIV
jgi:hypothetical protein